MFVTHILGPETVNHHDTTVQTWIEIESAIRLLDGDIKTLLVLSTGDVVPHLSIGGGNDLYVCYATFDNESFHNLIDPSKASDQELPLVAGGQEGLYPAQQCVNLETVLIAARAFAEDGKLSDAVSWQSE